MQTLNGKLHRRFPITRLVLCVILAATAVAGLAQPAQAAGTYTHSWFIERAIQKLVIEGGYSELVTLLNKYPAIVNYGSVFPDITYGNIDHDWGEKAHDSGDVNANYAKFLQYMDDHYYDNLVIEPQLGYIRDFLTDPDYNPVLPLFRATLMKLLMGSFNNSPRSTEDEKAIAFLFGLIAHQESDSPWHLQDPVWLGLEEYAKHNGYNSCGLIGDMDQPETCIDVVLRNFDYPVHPMGVGYLATIEPTILTAADTAGILRPICKGRTLPWACLSSSSDPLVDGQGQVMALWDIMALNDFRSVAWRTFVQTYVPGGIEYGSAFVVAAWMQAWDKMSGPNIYYAKPAATGTGNCKDWDNACSLQDALRLPFLNGEIWTAAGVHKSTQEVTDRIATFKLRPDAEVYGGFAGTETSRYQRDPLVNKTILSGDIDSNDLDPDADGILATASDIQGNNSYHVVTSVTGGKLDGFFITAGNANEGNICPGFNCTCPGTGCGGGMQNLDAGTLITNVTFSGNNAIVGGGMFIRSSSGGSSIPTPTITSVTFFGNTATNGGGMFIDHSLASISNVTFSENSAATDGGGIYFYSYRNVIAHATVSDNNAGRAGGGVFVFPAPSGMPVQIRNSILWSNAAPTGAQAFSDAWTSDDSIYMVTSVVQGGCPPQSSCLFINDTDPMLGALGDHGGSTPTIPLLADSSAINTAAEDMCYASIGMSGAGSVDQRGVIRPQDSVCDIGAFEMDNTPPSLISFTRHNPATSPTNVDQLVFVATFNENVLNVDALDFTITGTTASITNVSPVSESEFEITLSGGDLPSLDGIVGLDLAPGQDITDMGRFALPASEPTIDETYEVSNAELYVVSFTRQNPAANPTNADELVFRATFSAVAQYLHPTAFAVTGSTASVTLITPVSSSIYDITISSGDLTGLDGTVGLDLSPFSEISDLNGDPMPIVEPDIDETYTLDNTSPSMDSITRWIPVSNPTAADLLIFEVLFNEGVQNVGAADFTVTGTTASITGVQMISPDVYHLTVTGGDLAGLTGTVGLDLAPAQDILDLAGNPLPAGEPPIDEVFTLDNTPPALLSFTRFDPATSPTNADVLIFRATFSEGVENVDLVDFVVTGSTATVTSISMSAMGTVHDITVSGGDLADLNGTVGVDLAAGQDITDLVGIPLPAGEPPTDETYRVDNIAPTANSILRHVPLDSLTNANSITFRVAFGEGVQNVDIADFTLAFTGTVTGSIATVNPVSTSVYDVEITGVDGDGILDLDFDPAHDITDLAGNPLSSAPVLVTEETYLLDNIFPIIIFGDHTRPSDNSVISPGPLYIFIEFSEDVVNDGLLEAADSITNYLLVNAGLNQTFDTVDCAGGVLADDVPVVINSIEYTHDSQTGPYIATLTINNGIHPRSGSYRLYICGTTSIHDPAGNHLNDGESDEWLTFTVARRLPDTGFAPGRVTLLPDQPAAKAYAELGYLWLEIPRLGVKVPIVGVPLLADGTWDVSWLAQNAGWLKGSAFPTLPGNSVLTGHVYDSFGNSGPFANLNQLGYGDKVIVHAWGKQYMYEVREVLQVAPQSTSTLLQHQEYPWLTLVTCRGFEEAAWSYTYRVLVRAVLVDVK